MAYLSLARVSLFFAPTARRIAVIGMLLMFVLPYPAAAQTPNPDVPAYTALMRQALAAAQRNDAFGVREAAAQLATISSVRGPDGTLLPVDNRELHALMVQDDPDMLVLATRLGAIVDALAQPTSSAPADAQAQLERILSNPPFAQAPSDPSWMEQFFDRMWRVVQNLLRPINNTAAANGSLINIVMTIIGGLLLAAVLIYLLLGVRRSIVRDVRAADDDPEASLTSKTAFDQAGTLARDGDYRTAMRYLYLAALLRLDERDLLRYDRALTNREYVEQTKHNPALQARLLPVVETFDRVWYGHAPLDDATFAAFRAQVEALRE